jgi:hypothetical protein
MAGWFRAIDVLLAAPPTLPHGGGGDAPDKRGQDGEGNDSICMDGRLIGTGGSSSMAMTVPRKHDYIVIENALVSSRPVQRVDG